MLQTLEHYIDDARVQSERRTEDERDTRGFARQAATQFLEVARDVHPR